MQFKTQTAEMNGMELCMILMQEILHVADIFSDLVAIIWNEALLSGGVLQSIRDINYSVVQNTILRLMFIFILLELLYSEQLN